MSKNNIIVLLSIFAFLGLAMYFPFTPKPTKIIYPNSWPKPVYDFEKNPLTQEGIDLGRKLFYDPILSKDSSISCSNCHLSYTAFTHVDHALSHGVNDSVGKRNSPSLMNLAWYNSFMWDGSVNHLDVQALAPINDPDEMAEDFNNVIKKLQKSVSYSNMFFKAFRDSSITGENLLKAVSQFELTLISCNSKYDSVIRKESTFTLQEYNGYQIYQKNCASCHSEPLFTNHQFENNGLPIDSLLNDFGRYNITKKAADSLKFKVPTLRNIEFSFPYMHDGRFKDLSQVFKHYTSRTNNPILLTSNEKVDLTSFLLTITDKHFLFNKNHSFPLELFNPTNKFKVKAIKSSY